MEEKAIEFLMKQRAQPTEALSETSSMFTSTVCQQEIKRIDELVLKIIECGKVQKQAL